jgi:hypothetical protein
MAGYGNLATTKIYVRADPGDKLQAISEEFIGEDLHENGG